MTDCMKEAERLLEQYDDACLGIIGMSEEQARAALLAHIGVQTPESNGWKEATIAWEVCASIHREYAKKKDPFFTTRQADFVRHTEAARAAMLAAGMVDGPAEVPMPEVVGYVERWGGACRDCADESGVCPSTGMPCGGARKAIEYVIRALQYGVTHGYISNPIKDAAPAPDHFRDAAEMVAEPADDAIGLQPYGRHCQNGGDVCLASRSDGIVCPDDSCDIAAGVRIAPAPAEVPMPEPVDELAAEDGFNVIGVQSVFTVGQMRTYGAACRAAGEAAGYERGLKSRVPLDAINKMLADCMDVAVANGANSVSMPDHYVEVAAWTCGVKEDSPKQAPAPAEVPMPEPVGTRFDGTKLLKEADVRTYGDACRAAREAAGYARGLKGAGLDVDVFHDLTVALRALLDMPDNENTKRHARLLLQRAETALREEVK